MGGGGKKSGLGTVRIGGNDVKVYDTIPRGWKVINSALTAPQGYEWISNGKSRFSSDYKTAVYKLNYAD